MEHIDSYTWDVDKWAVILAKISFCLPQSSVDFLAIICSVGAQQLADCSDCCHPDALQFKQ